MPPLRHQRMILAGALVLAILLVVVVAFALSRGGTNAAALDPGLRRTAARVAPLLNRPGGKLPVTDASLKSFQAWVYNTEAHYNRVTHLRLAPQFVQVQLNDPSTAPQQALLIHAPGHTPVVVDPALILSVMRVSRPAFATAKQNGKTYRVYIVPLHAPAALLQAGATGIFEVLQAA